MRLKMKSTHKGSPDGRAVDTFEAGETYDIADDLAEVFLAEKWATKVKEPAPKPEPAPEPEPTPESDTPTTEPVDDTPGLEPFGGK